MDESGRSNSYAKFIQVHIAILVQESTGIRLHSHDAIYCRVNYFIRISS